MAGIVAMAVGVPAMVSAHESGDVTIGAEVGNEKPYVCCKWEEPDDDNTTAGIQVMPNQDANKTVTIVACVCDPNGNDDIVTVTATVEGTAPFVNKTVPLSLNTSVTCSNPPCNCTPAPDINCTGYSGTFVMGACDLAGNYTVTVTANDGALDSDPVVNTFEYLSMMGIELDMNSVAFPAMNSGDHVWVLGDNVWGGDNLTVHSTNNIPIDINVTAPAGLNCTNATKCDAAVIPQGNLDCDINDVGDQWLAACFDVNLECCELNSVDLSILALGPGGAPLPAGPYGGTVTFTAVATC